jgi:glycosyltransferase involved in cell wall biosynthesis
MDGISVVIPTYNRRRLLPRALASVQAQSLAPREVVVVDDGSTDGTSEMLADDFPWVTVLQQRQCGVSAARNRGIEQCTADWIAFLDSDDEWRPRKLERQQAALGDQPETLMCHTDEIWMCSGVRVNPKKKHAKRGGSIFEHCLPLCCISPSSALVHRSVFGEVGLFDVSLPACEDYDLWLRITCRYPVLYVDEPLVVKHGGHADQLSRRHWGMDRFRIHALEKILADDVLSPRQRAAARSTLAAKIRVYGTGAAKRGKRAEAERYFAKLGARLDEEPGNGAAARG